MKSFPRQIVFTTTTTAYYPPPPGGYQSAAEAKLEGGGRDCRGNALYTLQDYLEGKAPYVSVAMDQALLKGSLPYGTRLCLPAINRAYGLEVVEFRVTDTGSAFAGKGRARMDICVRDKSESFKGLVNREHLVIALVE